MQVNDTERPSLVRQAGDIRDQFQEAHKDTFMDWVIIIIPITLYVQDVCHKNISSRFGFGDFRRPYATKTAYKGLELMFCIKQLSLYPNP